MCTGEQRLRLAKLIEDTAEGRISPAKALKEIETESWDDMPWKEGVFGDAFHALQHFHIDEDIRSKDSVYGAGAKENLLKLAKRLRSEH